MKIAFVVVYLVIAIAMIAFIMLQRGSGAAAGSGFGSGASGTVFGARGSANFLSKATKWLAIVFFAITLFMAWYATHRSTVPAAASSDLGVMSQAPVAPAPGTVEVPAAPADATVPAVPAQQSAPVQPESAPSTVPAVPAQEENAPAATPQGE